MTSVPSSRRILYEVAEPHSGWFRASEAVAAGVPRQQLARYAARGVLQRSPYGVYRFRDFPARPFEDVIEACLWAGQNAVASHKTALAIYGLGDAMPASIHITVARRFRKQRTGISVHVAPLPVHDITTRNDVPITSVERTIRDVGAEAGSDDVASLIREAEDRGLLRHQEARRLRRASGLTT